MYCALGGILVPIPIVFYNLDAPGILFKQLFPAYKLSQAVSIAVFTVRFIILLLCGIEIGNMYRNFVLYAITFF